MKFQKLFLLIILCLFSNVSWSGECLQGDCKNGPGTYLWDNGDKYVGEFSNGLPNGEGLITTADGDVYEGGFKNSKFHGNGKWSRANGDVYVGEFNDNDPHGSGIYKVSDGRTIEGTFTKGQLTAGILISQDGSATDVITGEPVNKSSLVSSKVDGPKNQVWHILEFDRDDGRIKGGINGDDKAFIGEWLNGKPHGYGVMVHSTDETRSKNYTVPYKAAPIFGIFENGTLKEQFISYKKLTTGGFPGLANREDIVLINRINERYIPQAAIDSVTTLKCPDTTIYSSEDVFDQNKIIDKGDLYLYIILEDNIDPKFKELLAASVNFDYLAEEMRVPLWINDELKVEQIFHFWDWTSSSRRGGLIRGFIDSHRLKNKYPIEIYASESILEGVDYILGRPEFSLIGNPLLKEKKDLTTLNKISFARSEVNSQVFILDRENLMLRIFPPTVLVERRDIYGKSNNVRILRKENITNTQCEIFETKEALAISDKMINAYIAETIRVEEQKNLDIDNKLKKRAF